MWNYHPRASSSHRGAFYRNPSTHSAIGGTITRTLVSANHEGMVQWVKDFMLGGYGANRLTSDAADAAIPDRPALTARGDPRFPVDDLRFETSPFTDPQGPGTFGAMEWRLAEITPAGAPPPTPPGPRRNEIDPVWESGELPTFASTVQVPSNVARAGHRYRARVRMRDTSRRWSRWSEPVEFMASEPLTPFPQTQFLRITEIMYHAPEGQDHDFIELKNVGGVTVDLRGVSFTEGIEFSFAGSDVEALGPGEIAVVVAHRAAFRSLYGAAGINIAGEYSGSLANGGERLVLGFGTGAPILDFAYADSWYPLTDGGGRSLVIVDALGSAASWGEALSWAASADDGGSPGADEGGPPPGGRQLAGDSNQDGALDVADAVSLLLRLFPGADPAPLPCAGTLSGGGNLTLLDLNGDAILNLVDVLHLLNYLVRSGPPPSPSTTCFRIEGCPNACGF
jgi:hypothetical protein